MFTMAVCHEDEPCWDCTTMGNRVCGNVYTSTPTPDTIQTLSTVVDRSPHSEGELAHTGSNSAPIANAGLLLLLAGLFCMLIVGLSKIREKLNG